MDGDQSQSRNEVESGWRLGELHVETSLSILVNPCQSYIHHLSIESTIDSHMTDCLLLQQCRVQTHWTLPLALLALLQAYYRYCIITSLGCNH